MNNLDKRSIQISGSYNKETDKQIIEFSHELIKSICRKLFKEGAVVISVVGEEKCVFNWDVLETSYEYAKDLLFSEKTKNIVQVISSEKSESQIPDTRIELWNNLTGKNIVCINRISPGWNAGAFKRQKQEELSDALLILGGGEGVEHSTYLHISHGKRVIALDIPLGACYSDGLGGAPLINRKSISNPRKFFPRFENDIVTKLAHLKFEQWKKNPDEYANKILELLEIIVKPQVFFVRLLNKERDDYECVEKFFRNIIDPVVKELRYTVVQMEISEVKSPFLNEEIFRNINNSSIVIVDLTGLRPNCFTEMGYSFGLKKKVLCTAKDGTAIPFDSNQIPCYFWKPDGRPKTQQKEFLDFWNRNINRSPLIPDIDVI